MSDIELERIQLRNLTRDNCNLQKQILELTLAIKVKDEALLYFAGSIGVRDHERNIAQKALSTPNTDDILKPIVEALRKIYQMAAGEIETEGDCDALNKCGATAQDALSLLGEK